jgi:hypothetical protein
MKVKQEYKLILNLSLTIFSFKISTMGKRSRCNLSTDARNVRRRLHRQQIKEQQKIKNVVVRKIKRSFSIIEKKRKWREAHTAMKAIKR